VRDFQNSNRAGDHRRCGWRPGRGRAGSGNFPPRGRRHGIRLVGLSRTAQSRAERSTIGRASDRLADGQPARRARTAGLACGRSPSPPDRLAPTPRPAPRTPRHGDRASLASGTDAEPAERLALATGRRNRSAPHGSDQRTGSPHPLRGTHERPKVRERPFRERRSSWASRSTGSGARRTARQPDLAERHRGNARFLVQQRRRKSAQRTMLRGFSSVTPQTSVPPAPSRHDSICSARYSRIRLTGDEEWRSLGMAVPQNPMIS